MEDERDGLARKLDVRRNGDKAGAHDGEVSDEHLGAIEGKDRDPIAARETAGGKRSCARVDLPVEFAVGKCPRILPVAAVNQRDITVGCRGIAQITEIERLVHVSLNQRKQSAIISYLAGRNAVLS